MMFDALVKENDIDIPQKDVDFIKGIHLGSQAFALRSNFVS